ncbi:hypothetical protein EAE96_010934 [Botrytis aclada]|nr:hypothetical protein EAE96_010934 [Botrytis aclada]
MTPPTIRLFLFQFNSSSSTQVLSPASISTLNDHRSGFPKKEFIEFRGDEMIVVSLYRYEQEDGFTQFSEELPSKSLEVSPLSIPADTTPGFPLFQKCYKSYWEGLIRASKAHLPCAEIRDVEKISGVASWSRMIFKT